MHPSANVCRTEAQIIGWDRSGLRGFVPPQANSWNKLVFAGNSV